MSCWGSSQVQGRSDVLIFVERLEGILRPMPNVSWCTSPWSLEYRPDGCGLWARAKMGVVCNTLAYEILEEE